MQSRTGEEKWRRGEDKALRTTADRRPALLGGRSAGSSALSLLCAAVTAKRLSGALVAPQRRARPAASQQRYSRSGARVRAAGSRPPFQTTLQGEPSASPAAMPQMMENPAFERDGSVAGGSGAAAMRSVELGSVEATAPHPGNGVVCTDLCRTQLPPLPHKPPPSPWNRLKTVFLATIIAILVVWVIVFTTLSQLGYF